MNMFRILLCILMVLFVSAIVASSGTDANLKLVHVFYRHGDRTPVQFYKTDPFKNESFWPVGLGQLTKLGKEMEYKLGLWLRKRYDQLVGRVWKPSDVYIRSTDYDRTIMSAQCVLAAFYYPDSESSFNSTIHWTPTPMHTLATEDDHLINVDASCPEVQEAMKNQLNMPKIKKIIEENKDLFQYLSKHSGDNIFSVIEVDFLFDTLFVERTFNYTIPSWADAVWNKMKFLSDLSFVLVAYSDEMKRLRGGPMLSLMVQTMQKVAKGDTPEHKMYMYSAHDTTLSLIMSSMDVFNGLWPPYSTTVMVELYQKDKTFFVNVLFRNDTLITDSAIYKLLVPGCSSADCPLEEFTAAVSKYIPSDWKQECGVHDASEEAAVIRKLTGVYFMCVLITVVFTIVLLSIWIWKEKMRLMTKYCSLM